MLKITEIKQENEKIIIIFANKEKAVLYKFGKDIYTKVSENLHKSSLKEIKEDLIKYNWNINQLIEKYV